MNILLDHCVPRRFGGLLSGHNVRTTSAMKWSDLRNGDLLEAAAAHFDALVTVDRGMQFQQNVGGLPIAVIAIRSVSNKLLDLAPFAPQVLRILDSGPQKRVYVLPPPA